MPIVVDNNFGKDSYGIRAERLNAIQGNLTSFQPVLNAQPAIVTWAEDCYDVFTQKLTAAGVEMNESEGATLNVETKAALMEEEYQNAKILANTIYREDPVHLKDFGFDSAFPDRRNDKIARVNKVLEVNTRHETALLTTLLPDVIITRLTDAKTAYQTALQVQDKERTDARHAVAELSKHFENDTKKLQDLRAWAYAMLGKQDPRMGLIGMVNPQSGGSSNAPAAPTNLQYDQISGEISWDSVENATSYKVEISYEGGAFEEIYSGSELVTYYIPPSSPSTFIIHCMARNAGGFGPISPLTVEYDPPLQAPGYMSLTITNPTLHTISINWGESIGATSYRLYLSSVSLAAEPGEFTLVGQYPNTSYSGNVSVASRNYFYVVAINDTETSAPSSVSYIDMPA